MIIAIALALALIIAIFTCVFALQNVDPVAISFLTFKFQGASLGLIMICTFALGGFVGLLACVPALVKGRFARSALNKKIKELTGQVGKAAAKPEETPETPQRATSPQPDAAAEPKTTGGADDTDTGEGGNQDREADRGKT